MAGKCVTYKPKDTKQVKLDEQIRDESVTPTLILTSDSKGPEARLLSMISDLKLKNKSLQEECQCVFVNITFFCDLHVLLLLLMMMILALCHIPISVWAKSVSEDMYKVECEREACVMKTELEKVKSKNRLLHNREQALYKEIRRFGDSIQSQQLEVYSLRKQNQDLQQVNQNLRNTMEDILLKLPKFCKVSYTECEDGTVFLDLDHLD